MANTKPDSKDCLGILADQQFELSMWAWALGFEKQFGLIALLKEMMAFWYLYFLGGDKR